MGQETSKPQTTNLQADIRQFLSLIDDFGDLLTQETKALRQADFSTVDALQKDKKHYADDYNAYAQTLAERKDEFTSLGLDLREAMVRARTGFTVTLDENTRALLAAKDSAKRLTDRILDAARQAVQNEECANYSAKGQTQSYKTAARSLKVDQQL